MSLSIFCREAGTSFLGCMLTDEGENLAALVGFGGWPQPSPGLVSHLGQTGSSSAVHT